MAIINLLDKRVYNRISAGEVVERPASVVKELVENSIDANATEVNVTIENGGITHITVRDNGCGIEKDQLHRAFAPHATSKIRRAEDLDNITTLGFRGEALASIAAVSKATIVSKPEKQELGASVDCDGGELGEVVDFPAVTGTIVRCCDLFYNTPVRAKFLKSAKSEENEIVSLMTRLALANPHIALQLVANGKTVLQTYGGGLKEALTCVYGIKTLEQCYGVESTKNGITVSGYVGKLSFTKPTRAYQTLIVNGRYVVDATVSAAVQNAYGSYLMKRQYPFYVLNLTVPTQTVDVNVHPRKAEVRFSDNQIIYSAVYSVISKVLDGSSSALEIVKENYEEVPAEVDYQHKTSGEINGFNKTELPFRDVGIGGGNKKCEIIFDDHRPGRDISKSTTDQHYAYTGSGKSCFISFCDGAVDGKAEPLGEDIFAENKKYIEKLERERAEKERAERDRREEQLKTIAMAQQQMKIDEQMRYVGTLYDTYLVFENVEEVYLIDQHAAHERMLYDKMCEKVKGGRIEKQGLLIPYTFTPAPEDYDSIYNRIRYIRELGIEIDLYGDKTFKVSAIPCDLFDMNIKHFFEDLMFDDQFKQETIPLTLREVLMQKACKHAVKGGDKLSESEINALMAKLDGNYGMKCPHGRPVTVKISRKEIEKWFKRIV